MSWCARLLGLLLVFGCGEKVEAPEVLQIYAASSLTEAFRDLEEAFENAYPGADAAMNFAGSQVLRFQIEHGAPADVFASADNRHMQALIDADRVLSSVRFAQNELIVIIPLENPANIDSFTELTRATRLVIGSESVPAGRYAREALHRAGGSLGASFEAEVLERIVSQENNVRLARAKVELGEADAAIVYRTDASPRVRTITIPDHINVRASYPTGVVKGCRHPELANKWVAFVLSEAGQTILSQHGFVREG